jgi:hypothetical protein
LDDAGGCAGFGLKAAVFPKKGGSIIRASAFTFQKLEFTKVLKNF